MHNTDLMEQDMRYQTVLWGGLWLPTAVRRDEDALLDEGMEVLASHAVSIQDGQFG